MSAIQEMTPQEPRVRSWVGRSAGGGVATHANIFCLGNPMHRSLAGLQSMESQKGLAYDLAAKQQRQIMFQALC